MIDQSNYQFIDTNILVYVHDRSAGIKHEKAKNLVRTIWDSGLGCLSIQVLQELFVTVTRKVPHPLSIDTASQIIAELGTWRIHEPQIEDILGAIRIQERYTISFWDAMIMRSAAELDCSVLWSEDLTPGQKYKNVLVRNPFDPSEFEPETPVF